MIGKTYARVDGLSNGNANSCAQGSNESKGRRGGGHVLDGHGSLQSDQGRLKDKRRVRNQNQVHETGIVSVPGISRPDRRLQPVCKVPSQR